MPNLYIGTSGYSYPAWRNQFYPSGLPQKEWLSFYARHYNAVEVNATFYRPFAKSVFTHWHEMTPSDFHFNIKGSKVITHEKLLENVSGELQKFVTSSSALAEKLAAILWQFPSSAHADTLHERLAQFLPMLSSEVKHVFEFRHASWFNDETYALLNQHDAGFVINDSPRFPSRDVETDHVMYDRFHGPDKLYNSLYSPDQLRSWADKIAPRLSQNDVYLFFNNTMAGQALENANTLRGLLTE
jgi:uncharacterized protein YecE (DUF72 family)